MLEPEQQTVRNEQAFYDFVDITEDFFESINELKLGELMHHDLFGLFEAMSGNLLSIFLN